jgi:Cu-Zn family superoxide dismutase
MKTYTILWATALLATMPAAAEEVTVTMNAASAEEVGQPLGTLSFHDSPAGLVVVANLHGLPPGNHGFHVHEHPSCAAAEKDGKMVAALAAGGHYDPDKTGHHQGPAGHGHRGDLPFLTVGADGSAKTTVTAPRLKVADLKGRSLMIHAGGDTYSDEPTLGGGGARIACGVIQ